jgi:replicative DNA helicase
VAFISRTLKAIAKELNVPILALSQLSRATETRGGSHRPQLSDLRESGAIEQDADIVAFIHRPEYYGINLDENGMPTAGLAEIILAKHRNGAVCDVKLRFLKDQARFADMDADENSTAADPMGGQRKYNYVQSNMPDPDEGGAPMGGLGSGLGSAMGGGEFDLNQGPTNLDRPAPLADEVPF